MKTEEINEKLTKIKIKNLIIKIGNNVRKIRKEKNITQQDLAHYINSDRSIISALERGSSTNITIRTLINIAEVFNVDVRSLFND